MRRAKIVAILGPALDDREILRAAVAAGIDVVQLNFSHSDHPTHARRLEMARDVAASLGRNLRSLADLQGPKIRLGACSPAGVAVPTGSQVLLVPGARGSTTTRAAAIGRCQSCTRGCPPTSRPARSY